MDHSVPVVRDAGQKRIGQVVSEPSIDNAVLGLVAALAIGLFVQPAERRAQAEQQRNYKKQQFGSHLLRMRRRFEV